MKSQGTCPGARWVVPSLLVVGACSAAWTAHAAAPPEPAKQRPADAVKTLVDLELTRAPAEEVVAYLKHPDAAVRARAALALGRLQDWTVAETLVPFLADPDPRVRKNTAFALGQLDPVMPLLVPQIKAGKKGDDPMVRGPAMARATAEKKLDARLHMEERADVRKALYFGLGPLAIGAGLHHLRFGLDESADEAAWAARGLGIHGHRHRADAVQEPEIFASLIKLLSSPNDETRFSSTYALFRLRSNAVDKLSERLLTDSDPRVRLYAARGLAEHSGGESTLKLALKDPDWRVRVEAVRALASVPKPRGITNMEDVEALGAAGLDALQLYLGTAGLPTAPMAHVVMTVADLLSKAPPALANAKLEAMVKLLGGLVPGQGAKHARPAGELWQVRCALARSLDMISGAPLRVLKCGEAEEPAWRPQIRAVDVIAGRPGSDNERQRQLASYLHHDNPHVRLKAAEALAELDVVRAPDIPALLSEQVAVETDAGAAATMADGIGKFPGPQFLPSLQKALSRFRVQSGDGAEASVSVVKALAACAHKGVAAAEVKTVSEELTPLLKSNSLRLRREAFNAMVALGGTPGPLPRMEPPLQPASEKSLPPRVTLRTSKGDVVVRLYREDAPLTVTNFTKLARRGVYRQMVFHRVEADFVVQSGDPRGDGFGGPGYAIPCEYNMRQYERGVLGMALSGKDSGGSQFFITHSPQPHLDGAYTAFGEVESGMEVVDALLPDDALLDIVVPE